MIASVPTKDKILDAAEKLFGKNGFDVTSLRDITTEAQVNLASVNYHFQTKDSLIDAVIARRIEPINRKRLELLDAAGENPSVEQILTAFLSPILELDIESVLPLMGRMLTNPGQFVDRVYKRHLTTIAQRFVAAFQRALPHLPENEILWRLHFTIGASTHVLSWGSILPAMTNGICDISDRRALTARAIAFLAAGFRSPIPTKTSNE
jgi:AcrR family transcriptional regulator